MEASMTDNRAILKRQSSESGLTGATAGPAGPAGGGPGSPLSMQRIPTEVRLQINLKLSGASGNSFVCIRQLLFCI
jgi:hypothetical protein